MPDHDRRKWDRAAPHYEGLASKAAEQRWGAFKRELFSGMSGRVLFLAAGTGLDFQFFPPAKQVVAIDVSGRMLRRAAVRAKQCRAKIELQQMDVRRLAFADQSFDQAYTSCTFCSVSDPVSGLRQIRRVLRPGGTLSMFEHTVSRWFPFNALLHACTPLASRYGPAMNRPTVRNVMRAGFDIRQVRRHFLDVLKSIEARKPAS